MNKRSRQSYETGSDCPLESQPSTTHKKAKLVYLASDDETNFAKTIATARQHLWRNALRSGSPTPELSSTASTPESNTAASPSYDRVSPVCIEAAPIQETIVGWTCRKVISQVLAVTESERCMLSDLVHQPGDFSFVQGTEERPDVTHHAVTNSPIPDDLEIKASSPHFPGFVISADDIEDSEDDEGDELSGALKPYLPELSLDTGCIEDMLIKEEQMLSKWLNLDGQSPDPETEATINS